MTLAHTCLLIACLLPLGCAVLAKSKGFGKPRREGGFDNRHPRQWLAGLEGWHARAVAAEQNSFEALPLFIAGVLVAEQQGAAAGTVDALALAFVATRVAYIAAYVADRPSLRSGVWFVGLVCCVALFFVR